MYLNGKTLDDSTVYSDEGTVKVLSRMYKSYRCDENVQILKVKSFENVYKPSDLAVDFCKPLYSLER